MADLSNWMETFKDKMNDKSYQIISETLAANQFTSRRQLKLLTLNQMLGFDFFTVLNININIVNTR